jgi:uncharacterized protein YlbG (UPF0298 family)
MSDFAITKRQGLIVYFRSRRVARSIAHLGHLLYVSKHDHYLVLYVNETDAETVRQQLLKMKAVRKVVDSKLNELDPTVSDLESTGIYKKHDEDENK